MIWPDLGFNVFGVLLAALLIDRLFGEPDWLWSRLPHPAVIMGRAIDYLDQRLNVGGARRLKGAAALGVLLGVFGGLAWAAQKTPWIGPLLALLITAIALAHRSLQDHTNAVAQGLDHGLGEGRQAVSLIVGRDPEQLDSAGVARGAIESAAENFSDAVVAPAFWFCVAGLPGVVLYKLINTADSMIGYRTERHARFGWAAARLDDLVNLLPARLSGILIALVSRRRGRALRIMWRDARLHSSPNAGWPEAATAAALDIALAGPRLYPDRQTRDAFINASGRHDLNAADIRRAARLHDAAWMLIVGFCAAMVLIQRFATGAPPPP